MLTRAKDLDYLHPGDNALAVSLTVLLNVPSPSPISQTMTPQSVFSVICSLYLVIHRTNTVLEGGLPPNESLKSP